MHKLTKLFIAAFTAITLSLGLIATPVFADDICSTSAPDEVKAAAGCGSELKSLPDTIQGILNGVIIALGTVAVVVIVIGGITYITSTGDAAKLQRAKSTIIYAAIGLIICALAAAIVNFTVGIINSNTGNTSTSGSSSESSGSGSSGNGSNKNENNTSSTTNSKCLNNKNNAINERNQALQKWQEAKRNNQPDADLLQQEYERAVEKVSQYNC